MINKSCNYAYIDGANLDKALKNHLGWELDYSRFRIWFEEKYGVQKAYIFIGYIPRYEYLYQYLVKSGFTLIFKEVVFDRLGKAKGNCDSDLVLRAVVDTYENNFEKAVIVTSDGDYACLVKFLTVKNKLLAIISPASKKYCSFLLRKLNVHITFLSCKKSLLSKKERTPGRDGTLQGFLS